jgi:hypothetical protein
MRQGLESIRSGESARQHRDATFKHLRCAHGPIALAILLAASLSGCGVAAAPCRLISAALKTIPVVGHRAATPTDSCAAAIDP